jgi:hypothetical protein
MAAGDVGELMTWGEAWRLVEILLADPSSHLGAAVAGWQYPVERGELTLRDLYDLQHRSKSKRKPKPYPRPWERKPIKIGAGTSLTVAEYEAIKASVTVGAQRPRDERGRFVKIV